MRRPFFSFLAWIISFSLAFHGVGCVSIHHDELRQSKEGAFSKSEELEIAEGRRIHDTIVATHYLYTKPDVVNYVEGIGQSLARYAVRAHLPYAFTILVDERVYSTSAPGGFVYITTGLLRFLENEAELASVLAHEIGEIQYQLPIFSSFKRRSEDLAGLTALIAPFFGPFGVLGAMVMILWASAPMGASEAERLNMSDRHALDMVHRSGYDPQGLFDLLYRLEHIDVSSSRFFYDWQRKRPVTAERLENLSKNFAELDLLGRRLTVGHERYAEMMKSVREIYAAHS